MYLWGGPSAFFVLVRLERSVRLNTAILIQASIVFFTCLEAAGRPCRLVSMSLRYKYAADDAEETDAFLTKITGKPMKEPTSSQKRDSKNVQESREVDLVEVPDTPGVTRARVLVFVMSIIIFLCCVGALVFTLIRESIMAKLWPLAYWGAIGTTACGMVAAIWGVISVFIRFNKVKSVFMTFAVIFGLACLAAVAMVLVVDTSQLHFQQSWDQLLVSNPTALCKFETRYECSG